MLSYRRAIIFSAIVLIIFFFTYPRSPISPLEIANASPSRVAKTGDARKHPKARPKKEPPLPNISAKKEMAQVVGGGKQQTLLSLKDRPLREQLRYHYPYDVRSKFPAFIWQTWKYTPSSGKFDDRFRKSEASWSILNPGFVHEVITDDVAKHLLKYLYGSIPAIIAAYEALPVAVLKADFFRYLILFARGGVYSDIDTENLKSIVEWIPPNFDLRETGLVVGIEADPDRPDWADWYSRRIQFCQWTIQGKPGHPVFAEVIARITEETLRRKKKGNIGKNFQKDIVSWTGPAVWTDSIFAYFNDPAYFDMDPAKDLIDFKNFTGMSKSRKLGDVVVLPITSFSPGIGHSGAGGIDDPMAFVHHEFEGTWKPEVERHIGKTEDEIAKEQAERDAKKAEEESRRKAEEQAKQGAA